MAARLYSFPRRAARAPVVSDDILVAHLPEGEELGSVTGPDEDAPPSHPVLDTSPLPRRVSLAIWIVSALAAITFGALVWLYFAA